MTSPRSLPRRPRQESARTRPLLDRAERMLHRLPTALDQTSSASARGLKARDRRSREMRSAGGLREIAAGGLNFELACP